MKISVLKDGQDIGSFDETDIQQKIANGQISSDDLGWHQGMTDWQPLSSLIKDNSERILWSGSPSQFMNIRTYIFWLFAFPVAVIIILIAAAASRSSSAAVVGIFILLLICVSNCLLRYFQTRCTKYHVTSQRIRVEKGILSADLQELELFRVKDTMTDRPFLLRLIKRGNITILSGDSSSPRLILRAIPKAVELREKLRHEILTLRQKFNVRELDVM